MYSRTAFGMLWDFADPLMLSLVFYTMMHARILNIGDLAIPYFVYVIFGSLLYQTFTEAAVNTTSVFRQFGSLLDQTKTTPEALLLSIFFRALFTSAFRIAVMLGAAIVSGSFSLPGSLIFLLLFPGLILAGMSLGVVLAPFNAIYSDVGRALNTILVPLRYVTPTLFVFPSTSAWDWVYCLNPIAAPLDNLRNLSTLGVMYHEGWMLLHASIFLFIGAIGWFIFHVSVPVLAGRS